LAFALTGYLGSLRLGPAERVWGAMAVALAESFEQAPAYGRASIAGRLVDVLEKLEHAELNPSTLPLLEGIEGP
jgi:hypothetical protein